MSPFFTSTIGRLRLISFLEGISFILLLFIATPVKYFLHYPLLVQILGPIHGALFVLFIFAIIRVSLEMQWRFWHITWKLLLSSLIPFATFYVDKTILHPLHIVNVKHDFL